MPSRVIWRGDSAVMSRLPNTMLPLLGEIAGHHVDESGLAGAVAADQADDAVLLHRDVNVGCGGNRAEVLVERSGFENDRHAQAAFRIFVNRDQRPPGRNMITTSMVMPSVICQVFGEYS